MLIDIVIPTYNESLYIEKCILSIAESCRNAGLNNKDYRIILVDGDSSDDTIKRALSLHCDNLIIKKNAKRHLAGAWNIGLNTSEATFVLAMNAHATLSKNYISGALKHFDDNKADTSLCAVGGALENLSMFTSPNFTAVSKVMGSVFGVGNSQFRTAKGLTNPMEVDTLHCPIFLRSVLGEKRFDERLIRSQDYKFNAELISEGKTLILLPRITAAYYIGRELNQLAGYAFKNGYWVTFPVQYGLSPSPRHIIPFVFSVYCILLPFLYLSHYVTLIPLILYLLLNLFFTIKLASSKQEALYIFVSFFIYHFCYGIGSAVGFIDLIIRIKKARV